MNSAGLMPPGRGAMAFLLGEERWNRNASANRKIGVLYRFMGETRDVSRFLSNRVHGTWRVLFRKTLARRGYLAKSPSAPFRARKFSEKLSPLCRKNVYKARVKAANFTSAFIRCGLLTTADRDRTSKNKNGRASPWKGKPGRLLSPGAANACGLRHCYRNFILSGGRRSGTYLRSIFPSFHSLVTYNPQKQAPYSLTSGSRYVQGQMMSLSSSYVPLAKRQGQAI